MSPFTLMAILFATLGSAALLLGGVLFSGRLIEDGKVAAGSALLTTVVLVSIYAICVLSTGRFL